MKVALILSIILVIGFFHSFGAGEYFSFPYMKAHLQELQTIFENYPVQVIAAFCASYILLTGLAIPGSLILTILSGALFGTLAGTLIVSIVGTVGACLSFLVSRYLFKDYLTRKYQKQFETINSNVLKDGLAYIIGVRFLPVSPFVVINIVLGFTEIRLWTFCWTTYLGMLPGDIIYAYAGTKISEFESVSDILTPSFLISLSALGLMPFIVKRFFKIRKQRVVSA